MLTMLNTKKLNFQCTYSLTADYCVRVTLQTAPVNGGKSYGPWFGGRAGLTRAMP